MSQKEVRDKLIFSMQIDIKIPTSLFRHFGHQNFLQGDTIIIDEHD